MMGDFSEEALHNLRMVLQICRENNVSFSNEKCFMILIEGIALGNHVFVVGMKVDLEKIEVIVKMPPPTSQKGVQIFLGHAS